MLETGSDTRSGIGARLRAGRERTGLTQLQVAEKLHVDPKVVESLEAERFDALGAPVFVKGHLRHYAELIGEQPAQLVELYTGANKPAAPDLTKLPKAAPESDPSRLAVPALVVLIGFVLIGVVFWIARSLPDPSESSPPSTSRAVPIPIEPDVAPQIVSESPAVPAPAPTAAGAPAKPGAAATGSPATATPAAPAAGKPMEVTLRFAADSWVEVYDAKGERLYYDIGSADSQRTISGTPPFRVTFGNAPGVSLDVNGKPATVPASVVTGDEAQFVINRSGRIVRARPRGDGG
jgi:cytoskeleton protein RodZ